MTKFHPDKAGTVGDLLYRYMRARHRFSDQVEHPLPSNVLAALIGQGKAEFDEINLEPEAKPASVYGHPEAWGRLLDTDLRKLFCEFVVGDATSDHFCPKYSLRLLRPFGIASHQSLNGSVPANARDAIGCLTNERD